MEIEMCFFPFSEFWKTGMDLTIQSNIHISRKHTAVAGKVVFKEEKDTCDITDIIASILKGQVVMFQRCHFNFFELEKKL